MNIEILDTTLRDGAQGAGVEFSPDDKLHTIMELDELGVSYIEVGMITTRAEAELIDKIARVKLKKAKLCVFCRTVKAGEKPENDEHLVLSKNAHTPAAVIYGKASLIHVTEVLGVHPDENLRMIRESIKYLTDSGKEVIFDAEHFFDGYSENPEYAMAVVDEALRAGAKTAVLCDTNGGALPDVIGVVTRAAVKRFGSRIGIHCHNDMGMAAACTVSAVLEGASHIHGTVGGVGERCGNADLCTLIPVLQLKLGMNCIGERIGSLTKAARRIANAANLSFDEKAPFVGGYAFTHKAGSHIDGVKKYPASFEHIPPSEVGNERNIVISSLSGRAALLDKLREYLPEEYTQIDKDDSRLLSLMNDLKERESIGYDYEDAGASFALLANRAFGIRSDCFKLISLKVMTDENDGGEEMLHSSAVIKISVGGEEALTAGEGNGPVNALDEALRHALMPFYPEVGRMKLTDYKVRVLDSKATASRVRVAVESTDGEFVWRTTGVSGDVINASWQALRDSVEYMISQREKKTARTIKEYLEAISK